MSGGCEWNKGVGWCVCGVCVWGRGWNEGEGCVGGEGVSGMKGWVGVCVGERVE